MFCLSLLSRSLTPTMALWNFTIEDTSPFLAYTPYADGSNCGVTNGWIPWYQTSGFLAKNGDPGVGESYHITSRHGASVSVNFYGSNIYLYGTTNGSYQITLDGAVSAYAPTASDLLFSSGSIAVGTHLVTLSAAPSDSEQQLAFDRAIISTPLVDNATPTEAFYDNTDTTRLTYAGVWSTPSASGIPNTSVEHPWHETDNSASVSMQIGQGAVAVSLWGMANWGNWIYSVDLDGSTNSYNGSTFFQVPDALLFYESGLDPTNNHTITLSNISPGMNLALNSIRVYTVDVVDSTAVSGPTVSSNPPDASLAISPSTHGTSLTASIPLQRSSDSLSSSSPPGTLYAGSASTHGTSSSSTASSSTPGTSSSSRRSSVTVAITAGSIVGAALLLAFLGALLWWRLRRRAAILKEVTRVERYSYVPPGSGTRPVPPAAILKGVHIFKTSPSNSTPIASDILAQLSPVRKRRPAPFSSPPITPPIATSPATATSPTTPPPAMTPPNVDIDRLVELIAQRIDPTGLGNGENDAGIAPPQYRG
ncbi:hypothetical protein MSAN_01907300 [Mycena sanguinolenta]|uniref:Uncharacterized protein n=1 Tax=Mycena sanguinolenta TaxID=230812 RepID=A0A8H6XRV0_9AGAR|nr:hypothetical protein MSAN_01907300 [Mycena sanguinolenta]